jgi:hypothetical protein
MAEPQLLKRGVYVERTVGNAILLTVAANHGEVALTVTVAADYWDPEVRTWCEQWLAERVPPPLAVVR